MGLLSMAQRRRAVLQIQKGKQTKKDQLDVPLPPLDYNFDAQQDEGVVLVNGLAPVDAPADVWAQVRS